ncbi:MAG: TonB-dependent receptor plug domain-containing protein [Ferruginibacter sp.]
MKKYIMLGIFICTAMFANAQINFSIKLSDGLQDQPVKNYRIILKEVKTAKTIEASTNEEGVARFNDVPAFGNYVATATENNNYLTLSENIIINKNNQSTTLILNSQKSLRLDEVVVGSRKKTAINSRDATVASVITKKEIEALPVEGRDITKSFIRLPNVTLATLGYNEAPQISINGGNPIFTNYLIDGLDNNERFLGNVKFNTPFGFTESATILTNNYSVEYGNTSNGIVNVTTRSGTNKFGGEVFYLTRPGKVIDSKSSFAALDLAGNPVKDGFQRQQLGVGFGGAIKKDKTFYYINFEQTNDIKDNLLNSPVLGINETVRGKNYFSYASAKIDQYWNKNIHSSLRANYGSFDIDVQAGSLTGGVLFPSASSTQKNRTYLVALKNDYKLSSKLTGETNFQTSWFKWNYRDNPEFGKPGVNVQGPTGVSIALLGPQDYIFIDNEYTQQFQQKFKYTTGKHTLKAGVEFTSSDFKLLGAGNSNGFYTVRLTQAQVDAIKAQNLGSKLDIQNIPANANVTRYTVDLDKKVFGETQNVFNLYVEDNVEITKKLNISVGLRFDYDNLSKAGGTRGDWNNIGPRTSFNYKIDENNIIRGGFGVFYDKIKYSVTSDNLQFSNNSPNFKLQLQELQRLGILNKNADLNRITNAGNLRAVFDQPGSIPAYLQGPSSEQSQGNRALQSSANFRIKNPDGYQNPFSYQYTLGYQRKITEELSFITDLSYIDTRNLFRIRNLNSPSSYPLNDPAATAASVRTTTAANATRPVPIQVVNGQPEAIIGGVSYRGIGRDVFMTETKGRGKYRAMNLSLVKARGLNDNISFRLVYTLSEYKTDVEGINARATDNNNFGAEFNFGDNDRTHVFSGLLTWYAVKNLTLTPTILFQSGQPITRYADPSKFGGITDLNGNGEQAYANAGPSDYQPGEVRNGGGRLPAATTFDFSAKYKISINKKPTLELSADIYNLLNTENLTGYATGRASNNTVQIGPSSSNTIVKRGSAPPRQFQFGVRYLF